MWMRTEEKICSAQFHKKNSLNRTLLSKAYRSSENNISSQFMLTNFLLINSLPDVKNSFWLFLINIYRDFIFITNILYLLQIKPVGLLGTMIFSFFDPKKVPFSWFSLILPDFHEFFVIWRHFLCASANLSESKAKAVNLCRAHTKCTANGKNRENQAESKEKHEKAPFLGQKWENLVPDNTTIMWKI